MKRFTPVLMLCPLVALAACANTDAAPAAQADTAVVRTGLEVFVANPPEIVRGKRVGLITNHTGVDREGRTGIDLLHAMPELELVALFGPEHGIRGDAEAGVDIADAVDSKTGLPVHSLYGPTEKPTPEMMQGIEALVYDIQDVGVRQYTYESTMVRGMEAAAEAKIPFIVLDRPNPVTGDIIEGNILEPGWESFIGIHPVASRHGMTVGELARYYNAEQKLGADLHVVAMEGWKRSMWGDETGLPFLKPSPNLRTLDAIIHYPGTVYFEAVNLTEGRGTDAPFEQTGAPWLNNTAVIAAMDSLQLPGIRYEALEIPVDSMGRKHPGQTINGVRFVITDRATYRPLTMVMHFMDVVKRLHPKEFQLTPASRRLPDREFQIESHAGSNKLHQALNAGRVNELLASWKQDEERFRQMRAPYLLYQ
jgi:uncharacterized protein YbbC (DUF1343 family)